MELSDKLLSFIIVYQSIIFMILFIFLYLKTNNKSFIMLSIFMTLSAVYFGLSLSYYYANYTILSYAYYITVPIALLFIPLFYFYIQTITHRNFTFSKKDIIHFIPALLILVLNLPYLFLSFSEKLWFVSGGYTQTTNNFLIIYLRSINKIGVFGLLNVQLICYFIFSIISYSRYKKDIEDIFSYKENIDLKWIKVITSCFILLFIVIDTVHFFGIKSNIPNRIIFNILMLGFNLFITLYGIYQKNIFNNDFNKELIDTTNLYIKDINVKEPINKREYDIIDETNEKTKQVLKYNKSSLTEAQKKSLIVSLEKYMSEKPYFYNKLTIENVADALHTNSKYLSQVINENYNNNFYTYINTHRINDAKEMLLSDKYENYSMEGIAKTVGFNSKSSFNTAFKKYTSFTPSEYKSDLKKSKTQPKV